MLDRDRRWILGLAAAYVVLRLLLLVRAPVFWDEGAYAAAAQVGFDHPTRATLLLSVRTHHGPLQTVFAFGPLALGVSAIDAVRLLSVVAGGVGTMAVGYLAKLLAGPRAGLIAAALWVVLPFTLVYDSLGLADSPAAAMIACAILLALRLAAEPRMRTGALLGLALAVGVLAKETAAVALIVVPLALLVFDWSAPERRSRALTLAGALALATALAVVALLVPSLAPRHERVMGDVAAAGLTHSFDQLLTNYAVLARTSAPVFNRALAGYFGVPFLVLALAGVVLLLRRRQPSGVVVVACLLVPAVLVYGLAVIPWPRYLSVAVPALIVLAAVALAAIRRPALAVLAAAVGLALPLWLSAQIVANPGNAPYPTIDVAQFVSDWPAGTPWPAMRDALLRTPGTGHAAVVAYDGIRWPPFGLACEIGHPWFPVDSEGRGPSDVVYSKRGDRHFVFLPLQPAARPDYILEQPDGGSGRGFAARGYRQVAQYRRPRGGATVTLWRRLT